MKFWRSKAHLFQPKGRWHKWYPIYEMIDTFLYWTTDTTQCAPHIRDAIDMKRVMSYVVVATLPCILMSLYNTGHQALILLGQYPRATLVGWQGGIFESLNLTWSSTNIFHCILVGLAFFLPIYVITVIVGGIWEVIFSTVRRHEVNEGFLVTSILYTLTMPPSIPLWIVAVGISFGVVIGKEVFGGVGKNFLNPALTGRTFIYFAYPAYLSGDSVWTAVDGISRPTMLGIASSDGMEGVLNSGYTWLQLFLGNVPGSLGETSAIACLLGACFLIYTRIASWRIMAGAVGGLVVTALLFNFLGSETNPMFAMPWYWHLVGGGFAFGAVYMATDPVSASQTQTGRWFYGFLIGLMSVLIRVINPGYPEGVMLAIIFSNIFAPTIDYIVVRADIAKRRKYCKSPAG